MKVVAVIDDESSVLRSLARLLSSSGYEPRVFRSAQEFLNNSNLDGIDCIISDLQMPELNGLELQQMLVQRLPATSIVFLTGHADVVSGVSAMKAGAVDFLEKPAEDQALLATIHGAIERTQKLKSELAELNELNARVATLTPREREVFVLVVTGLLNKQIGAQLGAAEKTVKQHRARLMDKMNAGSLAELVRMAERLGVQPFADTAKATGRAAPR